MDSLIDQVIRKLGLRDEPKVKAKTTELVRLLELRSRNIPSTVNEYGKIILCADIAANYLGVMFDKENAIGYSGMRKSHYANNKKLFEKYLDLNKIVGVKDICVQLNINEVAKKGLDLLKLYKTVVSNGAGDIDLEHPQYAAMAVFQASKLEKKRISKSKILPFSNLKLTQWNQLEVRWDKFIAANYKNDMKSEVKLSKTINSETKSKETPKNKKTKAKENKKETENYEDWKQRMLQTANTKQYLENNDENKSISTDEDEYVLGN